MRMPPSTSPVAPPAAVIAAKTAIARWRAGPSGKVVTTSESAVGEAIAAPSPWTTRAAINSVGLPARPPASDETAKRPTPIMSIRRRRSRSPRRPPSSRKPPKVRT